MNVLAIGAHPDDIEFGCFGTLALMKQQGHEIYGCILTDGEASMDNWSTDMVEETRYEEAEKSAKLIGMKLEFLDKQDGELKHEIDVVDSLEQVIKNKKIDIVFIHSEKDRHQDHIAAHFIALSASRSVNEIYLYEVPSTVNFNPNFFVDISSTFKIKVDAIKLHQSQNNKSYASADAVEILAKFRALKIDKKKEFEAFEIVKIVKFPSKL